MLLCVDSRRHNAPLWDTTIVCRVVCRLAGAVDVVVTLNLARMLWLERNVVPSPFRSPSSCGDASFVSLIVSCLLWLLLGRSGTSFSGVVFHVYIYIFQVLCVAWRSIFSHRRGVVAWRLLASLSPPQSSSGAFCTQTHTEAFAVNSVPTKSDNIRTTAQSRSHILVDDTVCYARIDWLTDWLRDYDSALLQRGRSRLCRRAVNDDKCTDKRARARKQIRNKHCTHLLRIHTLL